MELLPCDIRAKLPNLYSQENNPDPIAYVKFFTPDSNWTWYITEFDGKDTLFGLALLLEEELGYFSLSELQGSRGSMGLPIERDLWFDPTPLSQIRQQGKIHVYNFTDKDREDPTQFFNFMHKILGND